MRFTTRQLLASIFWLSMALATIAFFIELFRAPGGKYEPFDRWRDAKTVIGCVAFIGIGAELGAAVGAFTGKSMRSIAAGLLLWPPFCLLSYFVARAVLGR
jgi:hypothetical protein